MAFAVVAFLLAFSALAGAGWLFASVRTLERRVQALETVRDDLSEQFRALTAGAVGQGERLNRLEDEFGRLRHRLDTVASQEAGGGPAFSQAIRLARRGASAREVMETCGLSEMEAELVVTLHRDGGGSGVSDSG
ncbi:DUF2802 domain-containing protein [Arhodomonas sp. AD133]|uniref:DUF2802 domain-containing protein n=1 Tax=Arhodomonas sp. AD133 TaxID=3415009 RepID=UPI003EB73DAF